MMNRFEDIIYQNTTLYIDGVRLKYQSRLAL